MNTFIDFRFKNVCGINTAEVYNRPVANITSLTGHKTNVLREISMMMNPQATKYFDSFGNILSGKYFAPEYAPGAEYFSFFNPTIDGTDNPMEFYMCFCAGKNSYEFEYHISREYKVLFEELRRLDKGEYKPIYTRKNSDIEILSEQEEVILALIKRNLSSDGSEYELVFDNYLGIILNNKEEYSAISDLRNNCYRYICLDNVNTAKEYIYDKEILKKVSKLLGLDYDIEYTGNQYVMKYSTGETLNFSVVASRKVKNFLNKLPEIAEVYNKPGRALLVDDMDYIFSTDICYMLIRIFENQNNSQMYFTSDDRIDPVYTELGTQEDLLVEILEALGKNGTTQCGGKYIVLDN